MSLPQDLYYTASHEWIRKEDDGTATVGITDHAQELLGDLVYIDLPEVDAEVSAGDDICVVESVKAASDVYAPLNGVIAAVNDDLDDAPEAVNEDPYEQWLFKMSSVDWDSGDLLDADAYQAILDEEA